MDTKKRREELRLASRLRQLAEGKREDAAAWRELAEIKRQAAERVSVAETDFEVAVSNFLFPGRNDERFAERMDLEDEAEVAEAEAVKAEDEAAAADTEAAKAERRAIGMG